MKFTNRKIGRSECLYILTDSMDPYTIAVYELIKSFGGYDTFDLSLRQIAAYRNMSYGKAQESFTKLKDAGIIKVKKRTTHYEADEYEVCDEWVAYQLDPKMEYNKSRKSFLDEKHRDKYK